MGQDLKPNRPFKPFFVRRHVDRKILRFSITVGMLGVVLTAFGYLAETYSALQRSQRINLRSLSEIRCGDSSCDTVAFATDWQPQADYVLDAQTRYFLNFPASPGESRQYLRWLNFSDISFIQKFHEPASYLTPDLEAWRLYSRKATLNDKTVEIMVGFAEKAPWKLVEMPRSLTPVVDLKLKAEADRMADNPPGISGVRGPAPLRLSADGFEIVDLGTGEVVFYGPWLPIFSPESKRSPRLGAEFYIEDAELYIVQTNADTSGRLLAVSLVSVGSIWRMTALAALAFLVASVMARWLSRRFLRNYFTLSSARVPDVREALNQGEGQRIEFKRGLPEESRGADGVDMELLKSIAAFANTNDGAIFIGIDDHRAIKGLHFDYKKRDLFEQRIRALVRNRIRPTPPVQISFEDVRGVLVARIAVARGVAPAYLLNGVIYVRYGSSDVQAQPEDLAKLVAEYAA